MVQHEINRLLHFARQQQLLGEEDVFYAANQLLDCLGVQEFVEEKIEETCLTPAGILANLLDFAVEKGLLEDTTTQRDLFDTRLMNCVMPRPSEVAAVFRDKYKQSPAAATDWYYQLSIASNYIRKDRIDKNIQWKTKTEYGDLDITINLSKPEKDPRDIAKARDLVSSEYPRCLLCRENEGFAGHLQHPARQTHRLISLTMGGDPWFLQYSPYTYYPEHCIVLHREHKPMQISAKTFVNLLDFLDVFPHYFVGSNADLPIVGGSILSHEHYQGGRNVFPMEKAPVEKEYSFSAYPSVQVGRVQWPMSALRISSENRRELSSLAYHILSCWRSYSDEHVGIFAKTDSEPHNTITPIARKRGKSYEFDLVLRNNLTSPKHPLGIFHPHEEVHHIKKENIGLIEVLGLAILPARLKTEMEEIRQALVSRKEDISGQPELEKHALWYGELRKKSQQLSEAEIDSFLQREIGLKFEQVLLHAGVFKRTKEGQQAFDAFVKAAGGI